MAVIHIICVHSCCLYLIIEDKCDATGSSRKLKKKSSESQLPFEVKTPANDPAYEILPSPPPIISSSIRDPSTSGGVGRVVTFDLA